METPDWTLSNSSTPVASLQSPLDDSESLPESTMPADNSTNRTEVDSPFSEPRQNPLDQTLPEILVTDYSPKKITGTDGLNAPNLLDWSVSCNSASDFSRSVSNISEETPGLIEPCPKPDSSLDENMQPVEEDSLSSPGPFPELSPDPAVVLENPADRAPNDGGSAASPTTITPSSQSSLTTSSVDAGDRAILVNGTSSSMDDFPSLEGGNFTRDSSEHHGGESDEEYFEEFHLPNTHENAFVRHLSFRRKVQKTPIHAPDAERIEGLVRTGEFVRHGSIRKKILPEEPLFQEPLEEHYEHAEVDEDIEVEGKTGSRFSSRFERDLREIAKYLSEDQDGETSYDGGDVEENQSLVKQDHTTSTPKSVSVSRQTSDMRGKSDLGGFSDTDDHVQLDEEISNIEESTIRKIQECLDFSAYKDMLNLSGRLSDILSPKEVEEVLSHSERYRRYLDSEVIEALSLSFKGQSQSLPYSINTTDTQQAKGDRSATSQGSSPVAKQSMLQRNLPSKCPEGGIEAPAASVPVTTSSNDLLLVRRNSVSFDGIQAPGFFVESAGLVSNPELRKISAPVINLDWSSDSKHDSTSDGDCFQVDSTEAESGDGKIRIHVSPEPILDDSDARNQFIPIGSEATEHTDLQADVREKVEAFVSIGTIGFSTPMTSLPPGTEISPAPPPPDLIPELEAAEEFSEMRHWRNVVIGGAWRRIDMRVITPYRKCISHGGYMDDSQSPIVVLSAALLPDRSRKDYHYVMDNLFMYVLSFLEQLVADNYVLVYFSEDMNQHSAPGFHWLRRAYQMIDRRLRKNLKALLLVHPSLWARTILTLSRPFVSSKFYRKLHYVRHLIDLAQLVPLEQLEIPDTVKQVDFEIMIREKKTTRTSR